MLITTRWLLGEGPPRLSSYSPNTIISGMGCNSLCTKVEPNASRPQSLHTTTSIFLMMESSYQCIGSCPHRALTKLHWNVILATLAVPNTWVEVLQNDKHGYWLSYALRQF